MPDTDAVDVTAQDHMQQIREEVKRRAEHGATLGDIAAWLSSNGFSESERDIGYLLAKTAVYRARRARLARYIASLESAEQAKAS